MSNFKSKTEMANAMGEVSTVLFELRDALIELSLALKDLQFETDLEKRKNTEQTVQKLLQKIASTQDPSA